MQKSTYFLVALALAIGFWLGQADPVETAGAQVALTEVIIETTTPEDGQFGAGEPELLFQLGATPDVSADIILWASTYLGYQAIIDNPDHDPENPSSTPRIDNPLTRKQFAAQYCASELLEKAKLYKTLQEEQSVRDTVQSQFDGINIDIKEIAE